MPQNENHTEYQPLIHFQTNNSELQPFYHSDLKKSLEGMILKYTKKKNAGLLDRLFSDKTDLLLKQNLSKHQ